MLLFGEVPIKALFLLDHRQLELPTLPAPADLELFLSARKVAVIHKRTREEVAAAVFSSRDFNRAGGDGPLVRCLAWLATEKHIVCTPAGLGAGLPNHFRSVAIVLRVELQPSFFGLDDHELAANVFRLMGSWLSPSTSARWQSGVAGDAVPRDEAEPSTAAPGGAAGAEGLGGDLPPPPADGMLRDSIFKMVLPSDWTLEEPEPPGLKATLFRYQRRALGWMRFREGVGEAPPGSVRAQVPKTDLCWKAVKLPSGHRVFYNCVDGLVSMEPIPPSAEQLERRGGILCDEMGLGKSVVAIALTLSSFPPWRATSQPSGAAAATEPSHGREGPDDATASPAQPLLAQKLMARMEGRNSSNGGAEQKPGDDEGVLRGGTLILCPPALLQQWRNELQNHAGAALRVEIYDGLQGLALMEDDHLKPAQREAELLARLMSGQSVDATYSSSTEADLVSARLTAADVVLTSLDVLQRDVHYQPLQRSLRIAKRYPVPESPLTTISWWRLVLDEAQMVGPMSAAGTMVARVRAKNRWCVSGTPIGARNLQDIQALLQILQHTPFSSDTAWSRIISGPLARGGDEAAQAWETLRAALQPAMWRNTKQVVSTEFQLPERSLVLTSLQFQAPELQFYSAVRDKMRAVRDEMVALSSPGGSQQHQQAGAGAGPRKRRRTLESLEEMVYQEVGQLRLACIHPQLTKHWRELGAELDLNAGGTVSMEEVMQRLVDKATFELQDAERSLCSHLNSLAIALLRSAADPGGGSTPKKRKAGKEPLPRPEALREALQLLETSFRVAEKGITAADLTKEETDAMPHPPAGPGATILAWKKLQINTAKQLELVYRETGKAEEAGKMDKDVQEKMAYVRAQAHNELASARERLQAVEARIEQARHLLALCWDAAAQQGFPDSWGEVPEVARAASAQAWVDSMFGRLASAQQEEATELEADENYHAMLGTLVQKRFGEAEKQLHAAFAALDKFVTHAKTETAVRDLQRAQARLSGSSQQQLRGVCKLMEGSIKLLGEFRCKTILSRWFHILVEPAAETLAAEPSEELRRVREAAARGCGYVAAPAFLGLVPGCVFKLGEQGLGYYPDTSPSTSRLRPEEVSQCSEQVLRALSDHAKRLEKQAGPGTAALEACAFGAVEAKLDSLRQQITLVRLLKDLHTAQSSVRLREELQDDVDKELAAAAEKPPVAHAEEVLRKGAAHWKAAAMALHHKVRFLSSRMEEAHHMAEPAAAAGEGSQAAAAAEDPAGAEDAGPASPAMDLTAPPEDGSALPSVEALPAMQQATEAALRSAGLECPVCLSVIEQEAWLFTACGHSYCQACTPKVAASGSCAVCRLKVTRRQVVRVAVASAKHGGQSCDPDLEALGKLEVSGDWSIKVQALVRRIRYLAENAPEEKSLVFSQFPDALKLVALALAANNIQHVQLIGGKLAVRKAMREFADNDGVRVFLLSHRVGAAGLTLVRASHVFLLEPALDPSIEQQAVARVHRIGQQRPVTVTRLIISSSVEEQVLAIQEAKQALFPDGGEGEVMTLDLPMAKGEGRLGAQEFQGLMDAVL